MNRCSTDSHKCTHIIYLLRSVGNGVIANQLNGLVSAGAVRTQYDIFGVAALRKHLPWQLICIGSIFYTVRQLSRALVQPSAAYAACRCLLTLWGPAMPAAIRCQIMIAKPPSWEAAGRLPAGRLGVDRTDGLSVRPGGEGVVYTALSTLQGIYGFLIANLITGAAIPAAYMCGRWSAARTSTAERLGCVVPCTAVDLCRPGAEETQT